MNLFKRVFGIFRPKDDMYYIALNGIADDTTNHELVILEARIKTLENFMNDDYLKIKLSEDKIEAMSEKIESMSKMIDAIANTVSRNKFAIISIKRSYNKTMSEVDDELYD